jgi:hypothetical protein
MSGTICLRCGRSGEVSPILQRGQLSSVRAGVASPLALPYGAPRPSAPLLWTASPYRVTGPAS